MNLVIDGNGPRSEDLNEHFSMFSKLDSTDNYKVWVGDGLPDSDVNIWITRSSKNNLNDVIKEIKKYFDDYPNLQLVGADNLDNISTVSNFCILISKDNIIRTFQNENDLTFYVIDFLESIVMS